MGLQDQLYLGNIDSKRDWGHAKDYVEAMYLILQQEKPEDFVIATGKTTTVREFLEMSFAEVGIKIEFKGTGVNEIATVVSCSNASYNLPAGKVVLSIDEKYFRPTEVDLLLGDPSKAEKQLGWKPKYDLKMLVKEMMESDLELFRKDKYLKDGGHNVLNYHE